jgi:hypothetical protein
MRLVVRCLFRWFVGLVLGLAPAGAYFVYTRVNPVIHDDAYTARLTMLVEAGCVAGAIFGAIWAARLVITAYEEGGARRRIGGP